MPPSCTVPMLRGLATKVMAMAGHRQGLLLDYLVDMLLNNIHFILDLFGVAGVEAMGAMH